MFSEHHIPYCPQCQRTQPANTRHSAIVVSMLNHRLRRWPNIEPTMVQCLVFAVLQTALGDDITHVSIVHRHGLSVYLDLRQWS